ncbi:hypothetical protein J7E25_17540, partial [Agromyces sp. ISL-38]|nr:hypothetical protein [Agromyces sp. ISL-38]
MPDALWWLPSVVVFAMSGVLLAGAVVGFRRLGVRRERLALRGARELEVRAKGLIVQADNATREAEHEVAFAEAQFGEAAAREVRTAVTRARGWLREAFLLQQRLDDAEPDSAAERRTWSARIEGLCRSALRAIDEADAALAARRRAERGASADVPALRDDAEQLGRRRDEAHATLDRLATRFAPSALAGVHASSVRVDAALADAGAALAEAQRGIAASQPTAERLAFATDRLERAARDLAAIEGIELELASAQAEAADAAALLGAELVEGRRERDRQEDADAAAALGAAVGDA